MNNKFNIFFYYVIDKKVIGDDLWILSHNIFCIQNDINNSNVIILRLLFIYYCRRFFKVRKLRIRIFQIFSLFRDSKDLIKRKMIYYHTIILPFKINNYDIKNIFLIILIKLNFIKLF